MLGSLISNELTTEQDLVSRRLGSRMICYLLWMFLFLIGRHTIIIYILVLPHDKYSINFVLSHIM